MKNAWDAFLLSIETQSTIGYGIVYAHPECGSTLPVIYLQIVTGFLFETLVFGFVFAKVFVSFSKFIFARLYTDEFTSSEALPVSDDFNVFFFPFLTHTRVHEHVLRCSVVT